MAIALLGAAPAAHASFPGSDGLIAFGSVNEGDECEEQRFDEEAVCPAADLIYRVKTSGRDQRRITTCPQSADCVERTPAWSPDGRRIAFEHANEIWVMDADGSEARSLGVAGIQPAWSPDGRRVVFAGRGAVEGIGIVKVDGSALRWLTTSGRDTAPTWSTRGMIAFARFGADSEDLVTMSSTGERKRRITRGCSLCNHPDFSPDGRRLAYAAGPGGSIYVSKTDGTSRRRLNRNGTEPAWSPSGRFIAYTRSSTSGRFSDIYVMRADGTRAHRLAYDAKHRVGSDVTGDYGSPSWQPR